MLHEGGRFPFAALAAAALSASPLEPADCNRNGEDDAAEIAAGRALDCNENGVPDSCDVAPTHTDLGLSYRLELEVDPRSLAAGDVDGNGRPDLVTAVFTAGQENELLVHLQDPSGSFATHIRIPLGMSIVSLELADLDADGDLDLAGCNAQLGIVDILVGDGTGIFQEAAYLSAETPTDLAAADLDGDGNQDLAFSSLTGASLVVLWNSGAARFTAERVPAGVLPASITLADLDLDGRPDLLAAHEAPFLSLHLSAGSRGYGPPQSHFTNDIGRDIEAADLTGDLAPEVLFLGSQVLLFRNDGLGGLAGQSTHPAGANPRSLEAADADVDGDLDLLVMNADVPCDDPFGSLQVFRNLGAGELAAPARFPGGPASDPLASAVLTADMDGDGKQDVVTAAVQKGSNAVFVSILSTSPKASSLDCDGNGVPDECDPDCNWNGLPDACEIALATSSDADLDGIPDDCEADCNGNGSPDTLDIIEGKSLDLDGSGFPDDCERIDDADCDGNGILDALEIADGSAPDCNGNGRPDTCDVEKRFDLQLDGFSADLRRSGPCTAADLDGDGILDFVVATEGTCCAPGTGRGSSHPAAMALFRGLGQGRFGNLGWVTLAGEPTAITAADLDLDGDTDVALSSITTCTRTDSISVFWNTGKGSLSSPSAFPAGGRPIRLIVEDMNGDAAPDVLALCVVAGPQLVRIFGNDGRGAFTEAAEVPEADWGGWDMRVADMDGDFLPDIVMTIGGGVRVFPSKGRLRFGAPREHQVGVATRVLPGDLDGDGDPDLVLLPGTVEPPGQPFLLVAWNARGEFPSRTVLELDFDARWGTIADLDGDGQLDIAAQGFRSGPLATFAAMLGRDNGSFEARGGFLADGLIHSGVAADMDGDGDQDILATLTSLTGSGSNRSYAAVLPNTGAVICRTGSLELNGSAGSAGPLAAIDLDADARPDLAVAGGEGTGLRLFWSCDGSGFAGPDSPFSSRLIALDPADLDGDGDTDIAAAVPSGIQLFVNETARLVSAGESLPAGSTPVAVLARDADGDGDLDLVTANSLLESGFPDNFSVYSNQGGGAFAAARNFHAGMHPRSLAAADFDGDGDVDLAIHIEQPPSMVFHENGGRGSYTIRAAIPTHHQAHLIQTVDADRDADPDLAVGPGFQFLINRGGWTFDGAAAPVEVPTAYAMGVGDLDGDGAPEIVAAPNGAELAILPNLGGGRLGVPVSTRTGESGSGSLDGWAQGIAVADLDGDGRNDIAWSVQRVRSFIRILHNRTIQGSIDEDEDGVPDECASDPFRRGDSNGDGRVDVSDPIHMLRSLFLGEDALVCQDATDGNDDSRLDLSDPISILRILFMGDPEPPPPSSGCGPDPSEDDLSCASSGACG